MANPFIDALSRGGSTANQGMSVANSIAGNAIKLFSVDNAGFRVLRLLDRKEQEKKLQELNALKTISDIYAQAQAQKLNEARLNEQKREFNAEQQYKYDDLGFREKQFDENIREFDKNLKYKYDDLDLRRDKYNTDKALGFASLAMRQKEFERANEQTNLDKAKLAKSIADKLGSATGGSNNTGLANALKALQIMPDKIGGLDNVEKQQLAEQLTTALLTAQNLNSSNTQTQISEPEKAKYKIYSSILKQIGMSNEASQIDNLLTSSGNQATVKQQSNNNQATVKQNKEIDYISRWTMLPNNSQQNLAINMTLADRDRLRKALRNDGAIDTIYKGVNNMYRVAKANNIDPRANKYFMNFFKELYKTRGKDTAVRYIEELPASVTEKELIKKTAERAATREVAHNVKKDNIDKLASNYGVIGEEIQKKLNKITPEITEKVIKAVKGQNILGDIIRKTTPFLGRDRTVLAPKVSQLLKEKELYFLKKYGVAPISETYDIVAMEENGDETPMQNTLFVDNPSELLKKEETRILTKDGKVKEASLLEAIFGDNTFKGKNRFLDFKRYLDNNRLSTKEREIVEANIAKMANILKDYKNTHTKFDEDDRVTATVLNKDGKPVKVEMPIRQVLAFVLANLSNEVNKVR